MDYFLSSDCSMTLLVRIEHVLGSLLFGFILKWRPGWFCTQHPFKISPSLTPTHWSPPVVNHIDQLFDQMNKRTGKGVHWFGNGSSSCWVFPVSGIDQNNKKSIFSTPTTSNTIPRKIHIWLLWNPDIIHLSFREGWRFRVKFGIIAATRVRYVPNNRFCHR